MNWGRKRQNDYYEDEEEDFFEKIFCVSIIIGGLI